MVESRFWDFFSSRRMATFLLLILILLSILGALIPQEVSLQPEEFIRWEIEHPTIAAWAVFLGLTHLFTNFVYITIILLISVSIAMCTYNRTALFFNEYRKFNTDK